MLLDGFLIALCVACILKAFAMCDDALLNFRATGDVLGDLAETASLGIDVSPFALE